MYRIIDIPEDAKRTKRGRGNGPVPREHYAFVEYIARSGRYAVDHTGAVMRIYADGARRVIGSHLSGSGYWRIKVGEGATWRTINAHTLICILRHGARPTVKHEVRHVDGKPANNADNNIVWGTRKENVADAIRHGTHCGVNRRKTATQHRGKP